jgi:heat shock protein HtpX
MRVNSFRAEVSLRIGLFLLTNLAVIFIASITLKLPGVEHYLQGNGLNLTSPLIFYAAFGFSSSLIYLLISQWMVKCSTKTRIIENPVTEQEIWRVNSVA